MPESFHHSRRRATDLTRVLACALGNCSNPISNTPLAIRVSLRSMLTSIHTSIGARGMPGLVQEVMSDCAQARHAESRLGRAADPRGGQL